MGGDAYSVERLVPAIEGLCNELGFSHSTIAKRLAYHIVCDQHQMASIDVDCIGRKDGADLLKDRRPRCFYTVRRENSADVIRLYAAGVHDRLRLMCHATQITSLDDDFLEKGKIVEIRECGIALKYSLHR